MNWNTPSIQDQELSSVKQTFESGIRNHHISNTAYPIAHNKTLNPYRINEKTNQQNLAIQSRENINELGLYVHIPFCENRCAFCEYTVVDPSFIQSHQQKYIDSLLKEFDLYKAKIATNKKKLIGFDIGGGTPSAINSKFINQIIQKTKECFIFENDFDISIETTPKIAANEFNKIKEYFDMGIRRISMGVQTINKAILENLGRTNTSIDWNFKAVENIRKAGFKKFNIDIMYGLPNQDLANITSTLKHVLELNPEYITLYRTRYKGTKIHGLSGNITLEQVQEQENYLKDTLVKKGYKGGIGKNTFSKIPNDHGTSDYLTQRVIYGTPYLGLGLGAQSYNLKTLSYNLGAADKRLDKYINAVQNNQLPIQDIYHLSLPASIGKFVSVSFYFGQIDLESFKNNFGESIENIFPKEVDFVLNKGFMEIYDNSLRLTKEGNKYYNGIIALFYSNSIKNHLINL